MLLNLKKINLFSKIFSVLATFAVIFLLQGATTLAVTATPPADAPAASTSTPPSIREGLGNTVEGTGLSNTPISARIGTVITTIISFVGVIFLILMVAGGLIWMTAGGSEEKVTKAKKLIVNAVIGVIITMFSYVIVNVIMQGIAG